MRRIKSFKKLLYAPKFRGKGKKFLGSDLSSESEKLFLDQLESIYNIKIERQFRLHYRFFDGRYKNCLLEIDGKKWHSKQKDILRDKWKDMIAIRNGFKLYRIELNNRREIPIALEKNKQILEEIFNG
jgi:hypothetical protein